MYTRHSSNQRVWWVAALACVMGVFAGTALADPPTRVARMSFLQGNVSFQPAGDDQWQLASLNRPLGTGDKVYTDHDSRVELEIGSGDIRLDQGSTVGLLNLDDETAQLELTGGVMNLHVQRIGSGQSFEVDTPTLAFVVNQPGTYRVDIAPDGGSTMVTVFDGAGDVYGENNASYSVRAGNSYRFNDSALHDYEVLDLPRADDFDTWCSSRDTRYERSVSSRYVPEGTIGYADLDDYGSWNDTPEYGNVWYPTTVEAGWAPYRSGHWSWIDPWGWSWVDAAPWGFAPFHYGRWAYIGNRWGWCPGRRVGVAIYAPALVGFIGGSGWGVSIGGSGPVGWFPLGPRDVYVPWYRASRGYFTNINVRNTRVINNTYIPNVYHNYSSGRPLNNANYAYRSNVAAVTAVSRDAFVGARPVEAARVQVNAANLRNAQVASRVSIAPTQASFGANARARAVPAVAQADRRVIARTAPPPRPVPIASRLQAIQRNGAQPLQASQLRQIATSRPAATAQREPAARVQVVGRANAAKPQPLPMRGATAGRPAPAAPARGTPATPARSAPAAPNAASRLQPAGAAARQELPSSRFAPHRNPPAQPARGNAPAVRNAAPAERAPAKPATRAPTPNERSSGAQPAPAARGMPSERFAPRGTATPPRTTGRNQPATPTRAAPATQRPAPRSNPEAPVRSVPAARPAPQRESRPAPQPYQAPRRESRPAPAPEQYRAPVQQRSMPQPPRSQPQPQQRPQPPARKDTSQDKKKKDDNGGP